MSDMVAKVGIAFNIESFGNLDAFKAFAWQRALIVESADEDDLDEFILESTFADGVEFYKGTNDYYLVWNRAKDDSGFEVVLSHEDFTWFADTYDLHGFKNRFVAVYYYNGSDSPMVDWDW